MADKGYIDGEIVDGKIVPKKKGKNSLMKYLPLLLGAGAGAFLLSKSGILGGGKGGAGGACGKGKVPASGATGPSIQADKKQAIAQAAAGDIKSANALATQAPVAQANANEEPQLKGPQQPGVKGLEVAAGAGDMLGNPQQSGLGNAMRLMEEARRGANLPAAQAAQVDASQLQALQPPMIDDEEQRKMFDVWSKFNADPMSPGNWW